MGVISRGVCGDVCQHGVSETLWASLGPMEKGFLDPGRLLLEEDLPLSAIVNVKSSALGSKM